MENIDNTEWDLMTELFMVTNHGEHFTVEYKLDIINRCLIHLNGNLEKCIKLKKELLAWK